MWPQPLNAASRNAEPKERLRAHRPGGSGWVWVGSPDKQPAPAEGRAGKGPGEGHTEPGTTIEGPWAAGQPPEKAGRASWRGGLSNSPEALPPLFTGSAGFRPGVKRSGNGRPGRRSWAAGAAPGTKQEETKAQNGPRRSERSERSQRVINSIKYHAADHLLMFYGYPLKDGEGGRASHGIVLCIDQEGGGPLPVPLRHGRPRGTRTPCRKPGGPNRARDSAKFFLVYIYSSTHSFPQGGGGYL